MSSLPLKVGVMSPSSYGSAANDSMWREIWAHQEDTSDTDWKAPRASWRRLWTARGSWPQASTADVVTGSQAKDRTSCSILNTLYSVQCGRYEAQPERCCSSPVGYYSSAWLIQWHYIMMLLHGEFGVKQYIRQDHGQLLVDINSIREVRRQQFCAVLYLSHSLTSIQNFTEIVPGERMDKMDVETWGARAPVHMGSATDALHLVASCISLRLIFCHGCGLGYRDVSTSRFGLVSTKIVKASAITLRVQGQFFGQIVRNSSGDDTRTYALFCYPSCV